MAQVLTVVFHKTTLFWCVRDPWPRESSKLYSELEIFPCLLEAIFCMCTCVIERWGSSAWVRGSRRGWGSCVRSRNGHCEKNYWNKCKKHFTKMLKDVGIVVPKIKELSGAYNSDMKWPYHSCQPSRFFGGTVPTIWLPSRFNSRPDFVPIWHF